MNIEDATPAPDEFRSILQYKDTEIDKLQHALNCVRSDLRVERERVRGMQGMVDILREVLASKEWR